MSGGMYRAKAKPRASAYINRPAPALKRRRVCQGEENVDPFNDSGEAELEYVPYDGDAREGKKRAATAPAALPSMPPLYNDGSVEILEDSDDDDNGSPTRAAIIEEMKRPKAKYGTAADKKLVLRVLVKSKKLLGLRTVDEAHASRLETALSIAEKLPNGASAARVAEAMMGVAEECEHLKPAQKQLSDRELEKAIKSATSLVEKAKQEVISALLLCTGRCQTAKQRPAVTSS